MHSPTNTYNIFKLVVLNNKGALRTTRREGWQFSRAGRLRHLLKIGQLLTNNFVYVKLNNRLQSLRPTEKPFASCQWR